MDAGLADSRATLPAHPGAKAHRRAPVRSLRANDRFAEYDVQAIPTLTHVKATRPCRPFAVQPGDEYGTVMGLALRFSTQQGRAR